MNFIHSFIFPPTLQETKPRTANGDEGNSAKYLRSVDVSRKERHFPAVAINFPDPDDDNDKDAGGDAAIISTPPLAGGGGAPRRFCFPETPPPKFGSIRNHGEAAAAAASDDCKGAVTTEHTLRDSSADGRSLSNDDVLEDDTRRHRERADRLISGIALSSTPPLPLVDVSPYISSAPNHDTANAAYPGNLNGDGANEESLSPPAPFFNVLKMELPVFSFDTFVDNNQPCSERHLTIEDCVETPTTAIALKGECVDPSSSSKTRVNFNCNKGDDVNDDHIILPTPMTDCVSSDETKSSYQNAKVKTTSTTVSSSSPVNQAVTSTSTSSLLSKDVAIPAMTATSSSKNVGVDVSSTTTSSFSSRVTGMEDSSVTTFSEEMNESYGSSKGAVILAADRAQSTSRYIVERTGCWFNADLLVYLSRNDFKVY